MSFFPLSCDIIMGDIPDDDFLILPNTPTRGEQLLAARHHHHHNHHQQQQQQQQPLRPPQYNGGCYTQDAGAPFPLNKISQHSYSTATTAPMEYNFRGEDSGTTFEHESTWQNSNTTFGDSDTLDFGNHEEESMGSNSDGLDFGDDDEEDSEESEDSIGSIDFMDLFPTFNEEPLSSSMPLLVPPAMAAPTILSIEERLHSSASAVLSADTTSMQHDGNHDPLLAMDEDMTRNHHSESAILCYLSANPTGTTHQQSGLGGRQAQQQPAAWLDNSSSNSLERRSSFDNLAVCMQRTELSRRLVSSSSSENPMTTGVTTRASSKTRMGYYQPGPPPPPGGGMSRPVQGIGRNRLRRKISVGEAKIFMRERKKAESVGSNIISRTMNRDQA